MSKFSPPHDCRLTIRCLKQSFQFKVDIGSSFEELRIQNTLIDRFFERRQGDEQGGEGGERIQQVRSRPVFALHSGRALHRATERTAFSPHRSAVPIDE